MPDAPRHAHLYFSGWTNESRAWRAGRAALDHGVAAAVDYVGYAVAGLPSEEARGPGETILRLPPPPAAAGANPVLRAAALPRWWAAARAAVSARGADLVVAHSLAALPLGVALKRRLGARLLYDAHELESEREGWPAPVRAAARAVETALIRACDHTIVVNDTIRDWYRAAYPGLSVATVRNVPLALGARGASALRQEIGAGDDDLVVAYVGLFGAGRGLSGAIEAFRAVPPGKRLVFIGYGPGETALRAAAAGMANVHVLPAVPQDKLIAYLSGADVGLFQPDGVSLSYRYSLPNKVFEYAAAGLAVLVGEGPELSAFLAESGLGWAVGPRPQDLAARVAGLSRAEAKARVAASGYAPPCWSDEKSRLLAAYRVVLGDASAARPAEAAGQAA